MTKRQRLGSHLAVSRHHVSEGWAEGSGGWKSSGASGPWMGLEGAEAREKGTKQREEAGSCQGTHCRSSALTALDTRG